MLRDDQGGFQLANVASPVRWPAGARYKVDS